MASENEFKSIDLMNSMNPLKANFSNYSKFVLPFIVIITSIVFSNTLGNNFIDNWDDDGYIINNDIVKHLNWGNLKIIFTTFYKGNYHPLTTLSYAIEYRLFGLNPFPFHLTNYILHLFNVIIVYVFLKRLTGKPWVAAITSIFFGIHPMHVESVAWISERKDLLYTLFFLLSLNSYNLYLMKGKKISFIVWTFVCFFLSLMSKSAAICLPLVLVLMDYYHHKKISLKTVTSKIPFFALALLFGILAVLSQRSMGSVNIAPHFNMLDRIFFVSYTTVYYLFQVIFPFHLTALHYYPLKSGNMLPFEYYLSLPVLALIVWGVIKSGRLKHELIFGLLFFIITIAIVLQILPVGMAIVSERYSYIPYIGIFFILGHLFSDINDNTIAVSSNVKYIASIGLVILIVFYSTLAYERNKAWKDGIVLFTDVIDKYSDQTLSDALNAHKSDFYEIALLNLSVAYMDNKMHKESIEVFHKLLILNPNNYITNNDLGYESGCIKDWDNGIKYCQIAINNYPDFQLAKNNLYWMQCEKTKQELSEALKNIKGDTTETTMFNLGMAYLDSKMHKESIALFKRVLKLNPNNANANNNLGIEYAAILDWDKGIKYCKIAIGINPEFQLAKNNLNWMNGEKEKLQLPDALINSKTDLSETSLFNLGMAYINNKMYKESIETFKKLLKLNHNNANANNNLGISYGGIKDWDNGIKYCQIAIDLNLDFQLAKNNLNWMKAEKLKAKTYN